MAPDEHRADDPLLSAGVVLSRSATGSGGEPGFAARWIRDRVARAGFEVTEVVNGSFSATGPASLFQRVFVTVADDVADRAQGRSGHEVALPVHDLSVATGASMDAWIDAVFLAAAPDFGPGAPVDEPGSFA